MICPNCGAEDKNGSKFCKKCGTPLPSGENADNKNQNNIQNKSNNKTLIIAVAAIICVAIVAGAFVLVSNNSNNVNDAPALVNDSNDANNISTSVDSNSQTQKSWKLIDTYVGDGSGEKTITVPAGEIRIEYSAYPIKNYGDNYLDLMDIEGKSHSLEWNSNSAVETKEGNYENTFDSEQDFDIIYYELENWEVKVYQYC